MAINQNHTFEDLDGVKCAIVEKNVSPDRVVFLKTLLEYNGFNVVVVPSPSPKVIPPAAIAGAELTPPVIPAPQVSETLTVGVSDVMFNATNAIFGRLLHTVDGHVVTMRYWLQKDVEARDEIPYYV